MGPADFGLRIGFGFRASAFGLSATPASFGHLYQLDLVALRGVNECDAATVCVEMGAIGIFQPEPGQVPAEFFQAVHREGEVRQIRLHVYRSARREAAQLDQFLAARRLEEYLF